MAHKIVVIVNPAACGGKALTVYKKYAHFLAIHAIEVDTYFTQGNNDENTIRALLKHKSPEIISVIGGDGTLNIVLNSLPNLDVFIHLIPAGTGNDLSKQIYDHSNENEIFELVTKELEIRKIDTWKCNDKRFINCFGAGFDGEIARRMFGKKYTILPPKLKYWIEIFRSIFTYRSTVLTINDKAHTCFMIAVANGSVYGGGFNIAPKADFTDGLVDLVIIGKVPVLKRFFYLPIIQKGNHLGLGFISFSQNKSVKIITNQPLPAQIDGEPMLADSYYITQEGKINFLV